MAAIALAATTNCAVAADWWEWSDGAYHTVDPTLSGGITAQVDNRGSGTTSHHVAMD